MPLIKLQVSVPLSDEKREELLASMSKIIAESIRHDLYRNEPNNDVR